MRYFQFCAQVFETNGQYTFSCTADDLEDNLKSINRDDHWAEALAIPAEHYRDIQHGFCSPALDNLLARIAEWQDGVLIGQ